MTRILIVEDERIIAWNIEEVLKLTDHEVISSVSTAEEAIAIARDHNPDLVIMDIRLNGPIDGIAAAEEIYSTFGIPSIYLTAHADDVTVQRAMETAPFGYILKPFKRNDLMLAIQVAINRHRQEQLIYAQHNQLQAINSVENSGLTQQNTLLTQLTSLIRDGLDDKYVMQQIAHELEQYLQLLSCHIASYQSVDTEEAVVLAALCNHTTHLLHFALQGDTKRAVHRQLNDQQPIEVCLSIEGDRNTIEWVSAAICPILGEQNGVLGDILVTRSINHPFQPEDVELLQQVADLCAIAIRQSALYQASQEKEEVEQRNLLSNDWVRALSRELRVPISNIKMAIQMLELVLHPLDILASDHHPAQDYFQILRYECQRELRLVEALVDANQKPHVMAFNPVNLPQLIAEATEPCLWQIKAKKQHLIQAISNDLPPIETIPSILKRVFGDLIDYVCRHTPPNHEIRLASALTSDGVNVFLQYPDATLSALELQRLLNCYQMTSAPSSGSSSDHSVGLVLALAKQQIERIAGQLTASDTTGLITLTVHLPFKPQTLCTRF